MQFSKRRFFFSNNNLVVFITEPFSIFSSCLLPPVCYTEAAEYLKWTKLDLSPEESNNSRNDEVAFEGIICSASKYLFVAVSLCVIGRSWFSRVVP